MPEGPFGLPRLTNLGPLTELTRDEKIKKSLEEFSTKVAVTEMPTSTQFSYRIDIPSGSDLDAPDKVRRGLPTAQNIPSNMSVVGNRAEGNIRPPNTLKRVISEDELRENLKEIITEDVKILMPSENQTYRPHIVVNGASIKNYLQTVSGVHDGYLEAVFGDEHA